MHPGAPRTWIATVVLSASLGLGCRSAPLPAPDPQGKDLVEGVVVAAVTSGETTPGIRTYKILHVDDYPQPIGYNIHFAAYDPKADTYEDAAERWKRGGMKVVSAHFEVRMVDFLTRDHRVLVKEPLTAEELAPYLRARDPSRR